MLVSFGSIAQQSIDLGTLWQRYAFYAGGISGLRSMNDSKHYTAQAEGTIEKYSYMTGEKVATLLDVNFLAQEEDRVPNFDSYSLSNDEQWALLKTETDQIYRRSSKSVVYVVNLQSLQATKIRPEKVSNATFSPRR